MPQPDHVVERLNAALEDRYRVERRVGEGGMATVYLAADLRHERKVALKVLKPELAAVVGAERFLAEIKTTANLQHPHILPLFDSGEAEGFLFYVMPYVEGESLRERLDREHQLPVDEAVRIASDVAEALEYAHSHGVIHRDIKPANILLQSGRPVISDFGIALAVSAGGGGRLTETGLSLGTPHYMSPEQATGDLAVGPAADVYALGCVLFEMLVGDPPYTGSTAQAILGKIVTGEPDPVTKHRRSVPPNVEAAILRALEKVAADRFAGAADFARALGDAAFRHGEAEIAVGGLVGRGRVWKRRALAGWSAAAAFALAFGWALARPEPPRRVVRQVLSDAIWSGQPIRMFAALAPDGSSMVLPIDGFQLGLKRANATEATPIPGTDGAIFPIYSPDGAWIAYQMGRELRRQPVSGGPAITLANDLSETNERPTAWLDDGTVLYQRTAPGSAVGAEARELRRIDAETGEPIGDPLSLSDAQRATWAHGLPGSRGALVVACPANCPTRELYVVDLETASWTRVLPGVARAWYASTGHLVYVLESGGVFAAPFSLRRLEVLGPGVPILEGVRTVGQDGDLHLAADGTVLYAIEDAAPESAAVGEFVWVTRAGDVSPVDDGATFLPQGGRPRFMLSPDGRRVVYEVLDEGDVDLWVKDLSDGSTSRVTFTEGFDGFPAWFPDSETIAFTQTDARNPAPLNVLQVLSKRVDGTGGTRQITSASLSVRGVSPDGERVLLYRAATGDDAGERGIFVLRVGADSVPTPLLASDEFSEGSPAISHDGRWIAYVSNETGRNEVIVRPFPDVGAGMWQVSQDGGVAPSWAHNGRELFFWDPTSGELKVAEFTTEGPVFRRGRITSLFTFGGEGFLRNAFDPFYDVGPDDERFLLVRQVGGGEASEDGKPTLVLVQNFFEELRELMPQ